MSMLIRQAKIGDGAGIAQVHVQAWRESYRGIVPVSVLDRLSVEERAKSWEARLSAMGERQFLAVAVDGAGEIAGFAGCGPARLPELGSDGEIYMINIVDRAKRQRAGCGLMLALSESLLGNGFATAALWVFELNVRARAFYERLGGAKTVPHSLDFDGTALIEFAYLWPDISELKRRAGALSA